MKESESHNPKIQLFESALRIKRTHCEVRRGHRGHEMLALIQNAKVTSKVKSGDTVGDTEL